MKLDAMFYNFTYNYLSPTGQMRYQWGISEFDVSKSLVDQLILKTKLPAHEIFNVNLTAFNPVVLNSCEKNESTLL